MSGATIGIDARLIGGTAGGVEAVIQSLARGLSDLPDGDERYVFLTYRASDDWLRPYLGGHCSIHHVPLQVHDRIKRLLSRRVSVLRRDLWQRLAWAAGWRRAGRLPSGEGLLHGLEVDLMHFPRQDAFVTRVPSIYHPHDLLHRHFPELFSQREIKLRDFMYREFCQRAALVAVTSSWVKADLIEQFALSPAKVAVIPWGTYFGTESSGSAARPGSVMQKLNLPEKYLFYPAQTWPHKNHIGLIDALHRIRYSRGESISLVCSGRLTSNVRAIQNRVGELGMNGLVHFVGFVSAADLQGLYQGARGVVIPSLFEAASGPLWEAFAMKVPAACSSVTSLPDQVGDAALMFDPQDPDDMDAKIWRLWTDEATRSALVKRGQERVKHFSSQRSARHFRAHYRRILGVSLDAEDVDLLHADPLM